MNEQWQRFRSFLYTMFCTGHMMLDGDDEYLTMWFCGRWVLWTPKGEKHFDTYEQMRQARFKDKLRGQTELEKFEQYLRRNGWKVVK